MKLNRQAHPGCAVPLLPPSLCEQTDPKAETRSRLDQLWLRLSGDLPSGLNMHRQPIGLHNHAARLWLPDERGVAPDI